MKFGFIMNKSNKYEEFLENLYYSATPSNYINSIPKAELYDLYPELAILMNTPQEPDWHPEGDVFVHTMMVIDEAAKSKEQLNTEHEKHILMLSSLCHDLGKAVTTFEKNGRIVSPMHEQKGVPIAEEFLIRIGVYFEYLPTIYNLIREHLRPTQLFMNKNNVSNNAIIRLSKRVDIRLLLLVAEADHFGRLTIDAIARDFPAKDWLWERYKAIK